MCLGVCVGVCVRMFEWLFPFLICDQEGSTAAMSVVCSLKVCFKGTGRVLLFYRFE